MGFLDVLKGIGKGLLTGGPIGAITSGVGAAMGAGSQASAQNRDAGFSGQIDLEKLLMDRDKQYQDALVARSAEGRTSGSDAWHKLMSAQHVLNPTAMPNVSPYAAAPRQATDAQRQGADALTSEVMARLQGGNPIPMPTDRPVTANDASFRVDPGLLNAGTGEKVSGWLGAILQGLGAASKTQQPPILSAKPPTAFHPMTDFRDPNLIGGRG